MVTRTKPIVIRSQAAQAKGANFTLSTVDRQNIATLRGAYEARYGVSVSTSLVLSIALEGMIEDLLRSSDRSPRTNAEFTEGRRRVLAGAAR